MGKMPEKKSHLAFSHLGTEVMVYDTQSEVAYCLNALAGKVLSACDGVTLKAQVSCELTGSADANDLLELTLSELQEKGLLKAADGSNLSRRAFIARWGAAAAALPIIAAIQAPQSAHAASGAVRPPPS
jgi:hypothetical protein